MLFHHRTPRPPLDGFVDFIWLFRSEPRPLALERHLPTGAAQLIVNLNEDQTRRYELESASRCDTSPGTVLSGVESRYSVIDTAEQEHVAGVTFRPGGTLPFMRVPAHETSDAAVPLGDLWDRCHAATLRERLLEAGEPDAILDTLEQALLEAWRPARRHPGVVFALDAFARRPLTASVAAVTDAIGLSPKRFIERFKAEVGLTPKRYCRILRFQRAIVGIQAGRRIDWTTLALDCGYFDQAHFIHDFRAFAGLTPTAYQEARTEFRNHVKFLQSGAAAV